MNKKATKATKELIKFIKKSPDAFHAVKNAVKLLEAEGFTRLSEADEWVLEGGHGYYMTRNASSIIAFRIPKNVKNASFMICASHTDSPTFKLKDVCEKNTGAYVTLNVEGYGGMIISSWFDRPLSVSGRAVIKRDGKLVTKCVNIDRDLLILPNVAIHMNRAVNEGYTYNIATDVLPVLSATEGAAGIYDIVAEELDCKRDELVSADLYLYNRTEGTILGAAGELFSCPRIDNIMCAYSSLIGFTEASETDGVIPVWCAFDNEETGSSTKQGAASSMLLDTLTRICEGISAELCRVLPSSFMVSADNGHAKHPSHPEQSDGMNAPLMNGGIVIKYNASQRYTTDALSAAIFKEICEKAGVPVQNYNNRSDKPGGSTLGGISNTRVALNTVDIGLAQLAMHSSYETAGCADTLFMIDAMREFFGTKIKYSATGSDEYEIVFAKVEHIKAN